MHNLTPTFLLEQLSHKNQNGVLEAVVLFVDTSGFTPLTATLSELGRDGAEVLADILQSVFEPLVTTIYEHGGFIAGFAGDAFKAVFLGLEVTSYQSALSAARVIQNHMLSNPIHETRYGTFDFSVRASIAAGEVTWAVWMSELAEVDQQGGYTFAGDAIAQAIEGEDYAAGGEIVVTQSVFEICQGFRPDDFRGRALTGDAEGYVAVQLPNFESATQPQPHAESSAVLQDVPQDVPQDEPLAVPAPLDTASLFYPTSLLSTENRGEFRPVYTLFINVQRLPEPNADDDFLPFFFQLLARYGGYLCRIGRIGAGDPGGTFLLFWGAPQGNENDLDRILGFLLALQEGMDIPLRGGLTHSVVFAGFVGSQQREEYTCHGSKVNQAARQMATAGWHQILLDAETANRAQSSFIVSLAGTFSLKGLDEPQQLFTLLGRQNRAGPSYRESEFVGRTHELALLQETIQPLFLAQFAGVTLVEGEAGIGKSRLVHEFLIMTDATQDVQIIVGQVDEILREAFNPFIYALKHYFEQSPAEESQYNRVRFDAILDTLIASVDDSELAAELDRTRSFLGALLNLQWPNSLYDQLEPKLRRENTLIALKTWLHAEAQRKPLILLIEDGQWLDSESAALLEELARSEGALPMAILVTARPVEESTEPTLSVESIQQVFTIEELSEAEVAELAQDYLGAPASDALIEVLDKRVDGNPFYAEQLLLYLQEQGLLVSVADSSVGENSSRTWQLATSAIETDDVVPADLQAVLVARLDRLTQEVKQVVQTAAVLGREFSVQVLSQMLRGDSELDNKMVSAQESAVWNSVSEWRYIFRHGLLRDAAYEMQLKTQLRLVHQVAASAIEMLYADNLSRYYADLAFHNHHAERLQEERKYAYLAGQQAVSRYENDQAIFRLCRTLELIDEDDYSYRFEVLMMRQEVYGRMGARKKQVDDLDLLTHLVEQWAGNQREQIPRKIELLKWRTNHASQCADYAAATEFAHEAIGLAQQHGLEDLEKSIRCELGFAQLRQGKFDLASNVLGQVRLPAEAVQMTHLEARITNVLGIILMETGKLVEALPVLERALSAFQNQGALIDEAGVYGNRAIIYHDLNRYEEAYSECTKALELFERIGSRRGYSNALESLGRLADGRGELADAIDYYNRSNSVRQEIHDGYGTSVVNVNMGFSYLRMGLSQQARTYLDDSIEFGRSSGAMLPLCYALTYKAYSLFTLGQLLQANDLLKESLAIAQELEVNEIKAVALCIAARIHLAEHSVSKAEEILQEAFQIFHELHLGHRAVEPLALLAEIDLLAKRIEPAKNKAGQLHDFLESEFPTSTLNPLELYWICYRVLDSLGDPRSNPILEKAYHRLQYELANLPDQAFKESYTHNIISHQEIIQTYESLNPTSTKLAKAE